MKQFYQLLFQQEVLYHIPSNDAPVAEKQQPAAPVNQPPAKVVPTIKNQVLVVIDEPQGLLPSDAIFLQKVMEAVKVDMDKVEVLNVGIGSPMDFRLLLKDKKVNQIISFGVPFVKINLEILTNRYEPKLAGGVSFLLAESLGIVQADRQNKQALWNALKVIFKV